MPIEAPFNPVLRKRLFTKEGRRFENVPPPIHRILRKAYSSGLNSSAAWERVSALGWRKNKEGNWVKKNFSLDDMKIPDLLTPDMKERLNRAVELCVKAGGEKGKCLANALAKLRITGFSEKKLATIKTSSPDPNDGHIHKMAMDENGNGYTTEDGNPAHNHTIKDFKIEVFCGHFDENGNQHSKSDEMTAYFASHHPVIEDSKNKFKKSSMSPDQEARFKKCMEEGGDEGGCMDHLFDEEEDPDLGEFEMEIFRPGTHNGDDFTESDLDEIAANFHRLKDELRPKLKITHRDHQETVAGLASYGDIVDVFMKKGADGLRRLWAKIANVPTEVMGFVKNRRFPERSIEIYPTFKLGTIEDSPVYKNVLKAVALLGHEMPAVTGMEPIKLEECLECQGTMCFREKLFSNQDSGESRKTMELESGMKALAVELSLNKEGGE